MLDENELHKVTKLISHSPIMVRFVCVYRSVVLNIVSIYRVPVKVALGLVHSYMARLVNKLKVSHSVVGLDVVSVVDKLLPTKLSTKMLLHDLTVHKLTSLVVTKITHLSKVIASLISRPIITRSTPLSGFKSKLSRTVNTKGHNIYPTTGRKVIQC